MTRQAPALLCAIAACLVSVAAAISPQRPQTLPAGTASISGRVIEGATGLPLPSVTVGLNLINEDALAVPMEDRVYAITPPGFGSYWDRTTTKEQGGFTFTSVPAGSLEINATKPGWRPPDVRIAGADPVRWFAVRDGDRLTGVEIKVFRPATIRGRVTDDHGTPLAGIEILATAPGVTPQPTGPLGGVITDDRGRYAILVQPGRYVVSSAQLPAITASLGSSPKSAFESTFYPHVPTQADAVAIDITRGEDRDGIDFVLATRPAFRVAGRLTGHDGVPGVLVELLPAQRDSRAEPIAITRLSGQDSFGFSTVPPGRYVLRALSAPNMPIGSHGNPPLRELPDGPTLWAEVPVTVVDRDVAITLDLHPGSRVSGRVEFDGRLPPPSLPMLQQQFGIVIERADAARSDFRGAYLGDGRFSTIQLVPGRYIFLAYAPKEWRLKSVVHDGRDIRDYPFEIGSADIRDVVLTFTDRRSAIRGRVLREPPYETTRGWVTVFPSDRALWSDYGIMPRRIAFLELGRSGVFEAEVPPGTYLIAATPQSTRGRITAETLTRLAAIATAVVVGDGQTALQDLRLRTLDRR
jgi:protocatechuate 3,4-dioxygenase beta subunit